MKISFILNNKFVEIDAEPERRVIDILREDMRLTGTKEGCGAGDCGACTIYVDGKTRLACLMCAIQLQDKNITTIEGLQKDGTMHPIQEAFVAYGAVQCGFCTPGMVITAHALLTKNHTPSRRKIREAISGNLCRCTGYQKIVEAIEVAAKRTERTDRRKKHPVSGIRLQRKSDINSYLPETLDELWHIIQKRPYTMLYAGGTDMLVKLRGSHALKGFHLLCLERIEELHNVYESKGNVFIGACSTHSQLILNPIIQQKFPVLTKALKSIGSPSIRNMGTIGGNICTASPAGDSLPPLYVLNAQMEIRSKEYIRYMPIKDFILGPGKTALKDGEILYGVWLHDSNIYNIQHFEKVGQRQSLTISIASLAALLRYSENGIVEKARFAWGSVGPTVVESIEAETAITGKPLSKDTFKTLIPIVEAAISPIDDIRASKIYRRILAGNLLFRLIKFKKQG